MKKITVDFIVPNTLNSDDLWRILRRALERSPFIMPAFHRSGPQTLSLEYVDGFENSTWILEATPAAKKEEGEA